MDSRPRQEAETLVKAKYQVFVIAWDREHQVERIENVNGTIVRSFRHLNLGRFSTFKLALGAVLFQGIILLEAVRVISRLRQRPIIHAHDLNTLLPGCVLRTFRLSAALIYDCHEFHGAYSELFGSAFGCIIRTIEQLCLRSVDRIITVSQAVADYLLRFNSSTEVIYNCPRIAQLPNLTKQQARARLGIASGTLVVSSVGTIRYDCRLDLLLAVASLTKEENVQYLVVGDGPLAPEFRLAVERVHDVRLTIVPWVSREVALYHVLASDLTWVVYQNRAESSNPRMTVPWKFFESLACGVPVIVDPGTLRAGLVRELGCGVVLESDNPGYVSEVIIGLARNPDRLRRMGAEGRRAFMAEFNWEMMSRKLIHIYEELQQDVHIVV